MGPQTRTEDVRDLVTSTQHTNLTVNAVTIPKLLRTVMNVPGALTYLQGLIKKPTRHFEGFTLANISVACHNSLP